MLGEKLLAFLNFILNLLGSSEISSSHKLDLKNLNHFIQI